jgi:hypothetical protein
MAQVLRWTMNADLMAITKLSNLWSRTPAEPSQPEPGQCPDSAGTVQHQCDTGSAPVAHRSGDEPLSIDVIRTPQEHALKLREHLEATGRVGESIYQGDIEAVCMAMCDGLGWARRQWPAVGRELAKLPGVRKGKVYLNGERLTVYEITANVVPLTRAAR